MTRAALLIALIALGCESQLKPGFCEKDTDCSAGSYCSQVRSATAWHRCFPIGDGGPPDGDQPCTTATCGGAAPICDHTTKVCRGCVTGEECAAVDSTTRACVSGACVECAARTDCVAPKPACDLAANRCVACDTRTDCALTTPACDVATHACVECTADSDCRTATKPICDLQTKSCRSCQADSECIAGPLLCMRHQDGRCATDAEAIYVQSGGACSDNSGMSGGTSAIPYCSMEPAFVATGGTRKLLVVRGTVNSATSQLDGGAQQISIIGKDAATVTGANQLHLASGDVYIRGITFGPSGSVGCRADAGSTLRLDHVVVTGNTGGGILLNGAAFDIRNTTVTNNGPAIDGSTSWGGMLVKGVFPVGGPSALRLVTIESNKNAGLVCSSAPISGDGVFASGNLGGVDVTPTCGVTICASPSATCGAQP